MLKITKEFLKKNPKLVSIKESKDYDGLYVVKYNNKVFYDNLWCPELLECRGLVVDSDFQVVARPFDKIFNYKENGTNFYLNDKKAVDKNINYSVVEKRNGFMAAMTYNKKFGWIISTTGSLDSDFAKFAANKLEKYQDKILNYSLPDVTWIFEICDSQFDPHIIKEDDGEYLIGCRGIHDDSLTSEQGLDYYANLFGMKRPAHYVMNSDMILDKIKTVTHEGFVVRDGNGTPVLKLKSPYYLTTKFVARLKTERLEALLVDKQKFKIKLQDEEFFPLIDFIEEHYAEFVLLSEQERVILIRNYLENEVLK